jgi:dTDP-4-dehydrorhamnose reductase
MIEKILIFGVNGMLGRYVNTFLQNTKKYTVIPITRKDFDVIQDISKLEDFLLVKKIDNKTCIINCIGLIPQRFKNNVNSNDYFLVNSIFPQLLSKYSKKYSAKMIQPTTDCVYNGSKGKYVETDYHDEEGVYGTSKSLGECSCCTVIRTSIIGEELDNKYSFLEWVKNSKGIIHGYNNHLWNGITCLQYCKIINSIITKNLFWKGVKHIYSPDTKSKYELCEIIKYVYNVPVEIKKKEQGDKVDKTLYSNYDLPFEIPTLEEQIKDLKDYQHILYS